jgi:D-alanyl-D-alanine carboxypeptidase
MILENATGRPFYDLAQDWINGPHGLEDTIPSDKRRLPGIVQGTVVTGRQLGVGPFSLEDGLFTYSIQFEWCGGGFASTSHDLARWARFLFSESFLGKSGLTTMLDAVPAPELGPGRSYGLGVIITETRLGPFRGHDGFMPGYLTSMGYFPDSEIAAAIQVNTDDGRALGMPMHEILIRLVEIALEKL